ncbi:magnesium and cobalt transport protein CorA [Allonocardiopsis opalescens]|uniref:Magnesium transporter n=1 Tax=Allonocardiopsis opalescens TaxID=1144618 RepID=A0A2T0QAY7_9ACTN|nr:magnesium and cobalt transport protein CorA [Allonocardiopsis opalescens]PRY00980.1 magnesium transporter [Allonocardiopsis opalescens]
MRSGNTLFTTLNRSARLDRAGRPARPLRVSAARPLGADPRLRGDRPGLPASVIDCAAYVGGRRLDAADVAEAVRLVRAAGAGAGAFVWVGLHEPHADELAELATVFDLHKLAVEDAVHAHQRPKLERYDDTLFSVVKTLRYRSDSSEVVESGEIMAFIGPDFIVTVRHGEHFSLRPIRRALEADAELLAQGPAGVLHAIADRAVDDYLSIADALQEALDEVESSVFAPERSNDVERIYQLKRELIELKRAVAPLIQPMRDIVERELVPEEMSEYFRDVEDHLTRVKEHVEACDELLTSILQAHLAQVTAAESQDQRRMTAWVGLFAVPTAIAGIYGMNFDHMPELNFRYGYPLTVLAIVGVCVFMWWRFRRNGWI